MGGCSFSGKTSTKSDSVVRPFNIAQQRNNLNQLSAENNNRDNIAMQNLIHNLQNPHSNNLRDNVSA